MSLSLSPIPSLIPTVTFFSFLFVSFFLSFFLSFSRRSYNFLFFCSLLHSYLFLIPFFPLKPLFLFVSLYVCLLFSPLFPQTFKKNLFLVVFTSFLAYPFPLFLIFFSFCSLSYIPLSLLLSFNCTYFFFFYFSLNLNTFFVIAFSSFTYLVLFFFIPNFPLQVFFFFTSMLVDFFFVLELFLTSFMFTFNSSIISFFLLHTLSLCFLLQFSTPRHISITLFFRLLSSVDRFLSNQPLLRPSFPDSSLLNSNSSTPFFHCPFSSPLFRPFPIPSVPFPNSVTPLPHFHLSLFPSPSVSPFLFLLHTLSLSLSVSFYDDPPSVLPLQ
ncbi:unnamed protein product [Acanthosepion pharaonis]|uniref:Uncharacterized protein n=1 Tax=Acanthosepion pharaonis TaxID=158019 RepID=A0A812B7M4_ACAPH|nr:unnamed protein product [Sepia pharaonis]